MDETTEGPNPQSGHRTPFWAVGLILLGIVVVVLAGAFLLNQHFQPHVGIKPVARTPTRSSSTPNGHKRGAAPATAQSTVSAAPTSVPTVAPTPTLSPRQQVVQAYDRYWQNYSQALYTLNTSRMTRVATGNELHRVEAEVAGFKKRGYAVRVRVTHHALIVSITGDKAAVYDQVLNDSYAVDPVTKKPGQGSSQADREKNIYSLQKIHGVWKVTKVLRQEG
jgi:hypothetical protein